MKRPSNTLRSHEVWAMAETGNLELTIDRSKPAYHRRSSLTDSVENLRRDSNTVSLSNELTEYLKGNYRDLVRRLEQIEPPTHPVIVLLKVTCLLQMEARNELIGNMRPREYLRDIVLRQVKQLNETDELRVITKWLEMFCLGHELPEEFWSSQS